jgi:hypothetical protein
MYTRPFLPTLLGLLVYASAASAQFVESWENPSITAGTQTSAAGFNGWVAFTGSSANMQVQHPNTTVAFNHVLPPAGPAGGNQMLRLSGSNTGISRMTGMTIQANQQYTLSAAIGNSKAEASSATWSLQLWADTNGNGSFDGSPLDMFIGQQFGTSGTATNPVLGEWATNSYTFDSAAKPELVGTQLIALLNNNAEVTNGVSYYDRVVIPEPAGVLAIGAAALALGAFVRRLRRHS